MHTFLNEGRENSSPIPKRPRKNDDPDLHSLSTMKKIPLEIVALSHSVTQSHNYAVVLGEQGGVRRLPIVIGGFEAQAIAVAMEKMVPNRPLTHDLFKNTLDELGVVLHEVIISNLVDGIFFSKLIVEKDGNEFEIDSRTSDALAMAVRVECPIYTYQFILDAAGVTLDENNPEFESSDATKSDKKKRGKSKKIALTDYSVEELNDLLDEVLSDENYEKAAKIRDEIKRRETQG